MPAATDLLTDSDTGDDRDSLSDASEAEATALVTELKEVGIVAFVTKHMQQDGMSPREMLSLLGYDLVCQNDLEVPGLLYRMRQPEELPAGVDPLHILKVVLSKLMSKRDKRRDINTADDAVRLLRKSNKIMVLTGAGVSTSCGIPDFRSEHGIYARIRDESHGLLNDPQEMFDIDFFRENPSIFYSFAHELYPSNFVPSTTHRFIKRLEERDQLLRNYSQNIDTLEQQAGISRVLNCHGSFATATCIKCGHRLRGEAIKADIFAQRIPLCPVCPVQDDVIPPPAKKRRTARAPWDDDDDDDDDGLPPNEWLGKSVLKPDITFFGEKLGDAFGDHLMKDRQEVDLLLVIGTSLKVAPVSEVLSHIPHSVPQIREFFEAGVSKATQIDAVINRDPVTHVNCDIMLLGECDGIVRWLASKLDDWSPLDDPVVAPPPEPERLRDSHVWMFAGTNRQHRYLKPLLNPEL